MSARLENSGHDARMRCAAVKALAQIAPQCDVEAMAAVTARLNDTDSTVRCALVKN